MKNTVDLKNSQFGGYILKSELKISSQIMYTSFFLYLNS